MQHTAAAQKVHEKTEVEVVTRVWTRHLKSVGSGMAIKILFLFSFLLV
jgi:hypothetical protein